MNRLSFIKNLLAIPIVGKAILDCDFKQKLNISNIVFDEELYKNVVSLRIEERVFLPIYTAKNFRKINFNTIL